MIRKIKNKIYKKIGKNYIKIDYIKRKDRLHINCPPCFQDRTIKTLEMFLMAFEYAKKDINRDLHIAICCEDYPDGIYKTKRTILSYTKQISDDKTVLIPDFCFINWKETGMKDYNETIQEIKEKSNNKWEYETLFWRGNAKTHYTREILCDLSQKDNRIEATSTKWDSKTNTVVKDFHVSLPDHTKYKYLIDVQGNGYSGRIKMLMFSGRPLFIADRKWIEYWSTDVKPFVHYIPVKEDLSDLIDRLNWAELNPQKCVEIAENAKSYASNNLTREAAIESLKNIIIALAN